MPIRIAVIAEAPADFRHVSELIDRKVRDHAPDWWDEEQLAHERAYCGLQPGSAFTRWAELRGLPAGKGLLRNGGILGLETPQRFHYDYPLGRKALILCALAELRPDAVVLIRELDQQPGERKNSLEQARDEIPPEAMRVVLALPRAKREAWALAGWVPESEEEEATFATEREGLAFHPCERAEELDAMQHGAPRDAKRVLAVLTAGDSEREARCWRKTPWATLRARG